MVIRSGGGVVRTVAAVLFAVLAAALSAEQTSTVRLTLQNVLQYDAAADAGRQAGTPAWQAIPAGEGELLIASTGNRNVRGELRLRASVGTTSLVDMPRVWVRFRFPGIVTTIGKTRLGWGEGFVFNAADLIHGSTNLAADLGAEEIRSEATWLSALTFSLDRFSFLELVTTFREFDPIAALVAQAAGAGSPVAIPSLEEARAGARLRLALGPVNAEAGYLFGRPEHRLGLSAQWHLGLNWLLTAGTAFPGPGVPGDDVEVSDYALDRTNLTLGFYDMYAITREQSLSYRLEALLTPRGEWQAADSGTGLGEGERYGIYLYPELGLTLNPTLSVSLRGLYSPLDNSARWYLGSRWNVFQGFSLLASLAGNAGEERDVFGWGRTDSAFPRADLSLGVGVRYVF